MASLSDIAEELGISVSLVSKVLNDRMGTTRARPATVAAIRRRARELGYRKNHSAVALKSGRQNVFGVFIHRRGVLGSGLNESMIEGIAEEASRFGQKIALSFYDTVEEFRAASAAVHRGMMDGVIVGGIRHEELLADLLRMRDAGLYVVTILDEKLHPSLPNVRMDQFEIGRLGTQHLVDRGCRRIANIGQSWARLDAYVRTLKESGLSYDSDLVYLGEFFYEDGVRAVRRFIDKGVSFDGIVAQSDQLAIGALNTLLSVGRNVPDDVKIIGIDNAPFCEFSRVKLSSISQEERLRGRHAVRMVLDLISGGEAESITVAPVLLARDSSA